MMLTYLGFDRGRSMSAIKAFDELKQSGHRLAIFDTFIDTSPDNSDTNGFLATRYRGVVEELREAWGEPQDDGPVSAANSSPFQDAFVAASWRVGNRRAFVFVTQHDAGSLLNLWIGLSEEGEDWVGYTVSE